MKPPKGFFTRATWSAWDRFAAIAALVSVLWSLTPYFFPARQWIEIIDVRIEDSETGQNIPLEVERLLHRGTSYGRYEVTIRNAANAQPECIAKRSVPYDASAGSSHRIKGKTVRWWAYAPDRECVNWPAPPGQYYLTTQHCWKRFWWVREACNPVNRSNVFTVGPKEELETSS